MDDRLHAAQGVAERRRVGQVSERDLHADPLGAQPAGIADQAANLRPFGHQAPQHGGADEPRGAGEQQHRPNLAE